MKGIHVELLWNKESAGQQQLNCSFFVINLWPPRFMNSPSVCVCVCCLFPFLVKVASEMSGQTEITPVLKPSFNLGG